MIPYGELQARNGRRRRLRMSSRFHFVGAAAWDILPVIVTGRARQRTDVVCGYLHSDDPCSIRLRVFPPVFVVRLPNGPSRSWVEASISYALEDSGGVEHTRVPRPAPPRSSPELVLIEVLKQHLSSAPAVEGGWLAALRDPVLAPALSLLHGSPGQKSDVADLAGGLLQCRVASLDERFRVVLVDRPFATHRWRMHLAEEFLATMDLGVAAIARRVGYDSEEAFSRAFKRASGVAPSVWRSSVCDAVDVGEGGTPHTSLLPRELLHLSTVTMHGFELHTPCDWSAQAGKKDVRAERMRGARSEPRRCHRCSRRSIPRHIRGASGEFRKRNRDVVLSARCK